MTSPAQDIIRLLSLGALDADLDVLNTALVARRLSVANAKRKELSPGDQFLLAGNIRPQYLAGALASYVGTNSDGKLKCIMREERRRYRNGTEFTIPATLIGERV